MTDRSRIKAVAKPAGSPPLQPVVVDEQGTVRFRENAIVRFLLDQGPFDLNSIAVMPFSKRDREQFAMLIGYSLSGIGELSYMRDKTLCRIDKVYDKVRSDMENVQE